MSTFIKMKSAGALPLLLLSGILCASLILSCTASGKEGPLLDGKSFTVITMPDGNSAEAMMENITFAAGRFDNDNCHLWGFGDGAYTAKESGDSIAFTATTTSSTEGTMEWTGTLRGDALSGSMVWKKAGQDDMHYVFTSKNIMRVDLNGKKFAVEYADGDSVLKETVTFNNGMFESPACYTWGFTAAAYQAYTLDNVTHFQSIYSSAAEGKMLFYGTIRDTTLTGTQFWTKAGQADNYYPMTGTEIQ